MKIKEWLDKVSYLGDSKVSEEKGNTYFSRFDNSYITVLGMEDNIKYLAELEITDELTHGVGFSLKDGKWYGWSHRAIYGFEIGSTCSKGDCHYVGSSLEEQKEAAIEFWKDDNYSNVRCTGVVEENGNKFLVIVWEYLPTTPNESLHNTSGRQHHLITPLGKGEWTAKTMEDAKKMAVDFNEGVS